MKVKVFPVLSPRSGSPVKNQYVISLPGAYIFQSYDSQIAVYDHESGTLTLGLHWDYSVTTMKYLWQFLRENCHSVYRELPDGKSGADSIRKAIKSGLILYDETMI